LREFGLSKQSKAGFYNMRMLAFGQSILLGSIGTRDPMENTIRIDVLGEVMRGELPTSIRLEGLDSFDRRFSTRHLNFTKQSKVASDFLCKMEKSMKIW
jgi:hypothetical protein